MRRRQAGNQLRVARARTRASTPRREHAPRPQLARVHVAPEPVEREVSPAAHRRRDDGNRRTGRRCCCCCRIWHNGPWFCSTRGGRQRWCGLRRGSHRWRSSRRRGDCCSMRWSTVAHKARHVRRVLHDDADRRAHEHVVCPVRDDNRGQVALLGLRLVVHRRLVRVHLHVYRGGSARPPPPPQADTAMRPRTATIASPALICSPIVLRHATMLPVFCRRNTTTTREWLLS